MAEDLEAVLEDRVEDEPSQRRFRDLRVIIKELEREGFINRGGKDSHRNLIHPRLQRTITILDNKIRTLKAIRKCGQGCYKGDYKMIYRSKYLKIVERSEVDNCFIGKGPELFYLICLLMFALVLLHLACAPSYAFMELSTKLQYDSNVSNGISSKQGDSIMRIQMSLYKPSTGESRTEGIYNLYLLASGYRSFTGLNAFETGGYTGVWHHINPLITAELMAGLKAKVVADPAQSLFDIGVSAALYEKITEGVQLAQTYSYRKGFAREETYSYGTHSILIMASVNISKGKTLELLYDLSYGDSFRTLQRGQSIGDYNSQESIKESIGRRHRNSRAFGNPVIKEKVSSNTIGATVSLDIGYPWTVLMGYNYNFINGNSGVSKGYSASVSLGLRF